ncbi:Predicted methyltransferase [Sphingomonas gellani]|uniref:Predicted methyltransferase n=1 Tax=Sphingomonas gellani TaxID=1166340 RepID=A0A1H8H7V0_9SPHN|nr:class I SAM-dependent methyltransferase [Sphingomonas gellani]SEN52391.1 Predicted methyltransferase [Sphingomonas gellani]
MLRSFRLLASALMLTALPASIALSQGGKVSAPAPSAAIQAALADPARADQAADDARRQAAAVIAFAGVKPGDSVIDFLPGAGYWTRIFSPLVGPGGHVDALWPSIAAKYAEKQLPALQARGLTNVTAEVQSSPFPTVAKPVDLFWTVQNYHDIPAAGIAQFNAAVLKALKPGGIYLIVDHADARGALPSAAGNKHRIDPAVVRSQVQAAGFRFVGQSSVLANPADDHSKPVFDPAVRGHTDQFVFKFRKP